MTRVVVIGGGLVGATAAHHLAGKGVDVVVVDRRDPGRASEAGAGIMAPATRWHGQDPRWPLARAAIAYYPALVETLADAGECHVGYDVVGGLHVAINETEASSLQQLMPAVEARASRHRDHIGTVNFLDGALAREAFPALGPVAAAIHSSGAARIDGRLLLLALERAGGRLGTEHVVGPAELDLRGEVAAGVHVAGELIEADAVVVATGAWSASLPGLPRRGRPPVAPQRGQLVHLCLPGTQTGMWPVVVGFGPHYLLTFPEDRVVVGATRESGVGFDQRATTEGVSEVLNEALRLAPGLALATFDHVRVGFRPVSVDDIPIIGRLPGTSNVYLAVGHGSYGLQLGPYSGVVAAELALGNEPELDLSPYRPDRFPEVGSDAH